MQTEEKYLDVLQNIETTIIRVRQRQPGLLDVEVLEAIEGLLRTYSWEVEKRGFPTMRLTGRSLEVFDKVHTVCEWRFGRATLDEREEAGLLIENVELRPRDLLPCLKKIRGSIRFWTSEGGRQGYLTYVEQFVPGGGSSGTGHP